MDKKHAVTKASVEWQRARHPEQKQQRRQEILDAAAALFEQRGLEKASLSKIAVAAGLTKAAVYRYFESREAIFLELLKESFTDWVDDFEAALAPLAGSNEAPAVAKAIVATVITRPRLAALNAATPGILEHNLSVEGVVTLKLSMRPLHLRLANSLHAALPALPMEQVRELLLFLYSAQNGLWPVAHPSEAVAEALQREELASMQVNWQEALERFLVLILAGALVEGTKTTSA